MINKVANKDETINPFNKDKATGFQKAVAPRDEHEKRDWQAANKNWWQKNPMRYDFLDRPIEWPEFSLEFFRGNCSLPPRFIWVESEKSTGQDLCIRSYYSCYDPTNQR